MLMHYCKLSVGISLVVAGFLFLLKDLKIWDFWGVQWWTVLFLIIGAKMICHCCCKECEKEAPTGKKK